MISDEGDEKADHFLRYQPWLPWETALQHVKDFAYIEDFWSLFNNLKAPSEGKYSYYLFKKGIPPKYEDPINNSVRTLPAM